jgi:hypothetical protein
MMQSESGIDKRIVARRRMGRGSASRTRDNRDLSWCCENWTAGSARLMKLRRSMRKLERFAALEEGGREGARGESIATRCKPGQAPSTEEQHQPERGLRYGHSNASTRATKRESRHFAT